MTVRHLVLGAGGFLGGRLVRRLVQDGIAVRGFGHPPRRSGFRAASIEFMPGDLSDQKALARAFTGVDVVHHLLGRATPAASDASFDASEAEQIARVLRLARDHGASALVFASSGGPVYGPEVASPLSESRLPRPTTAYGRTKRAVEVALEAARGDGLHTLSLRIANAYGPGQAPGRGQGLVATVIARTLSRQPLEVWGDGSAQRDYVHADDVAGAFARAAAYRGPRPALNIGSGIGRSVSEVIANVAYALDLPPPPLDRRPGRAADVSVSVLDNTLAAQELGWWPQRDWLDSLRETARWVRHYKAEATGADVDL